jgi:hypothetical protein
MFTAKRISWAARYLPNREANESMGPITYALCQKQVIGMAMFVSGLCAFPPLIKQEPISLAKAGSAASKEFVVPVDKPYFFDLAFEFPSVEAFRRNQVAGPGHGNYCEDDVKIEDLPAVRPANLGRLIPIHVVVKRTSDKHVVVDQTFVSSCGTGSSGTDHPTIWWRIGRVELTRGEYIAELTNVEAQSGLEGVKTTVYLVGGHGK